MKRKTLVALALVLAVCALAGSGVMAAGPEIPNPPTSPSGIGGFLVALLGALAAFLAALFGNLPF